LKQNAKATPKYHGSNFVQVCQTFRRGLSIQGIDDM